MSDECRRKFEKWALPYLKRQYSFSDDESARDMMKSSVSYPLWLAWEEAWNHCNNDIAAQNKLASESEIEA